MAINLCGFTRSSFAATCMNYFDKPIFWDKNLNIFIDMPLNALQFNLFPWQEPAVIALTSSLRKEPLLEICWPVGILFMPKELKHQERTSKYATILFMEFFPHIDFHN